MNTNRFLLSLVIGALAAAIAGFKAVPGEEVAYALGTFLGTALVSLLVCWKLGDVLVDIAKIPELRNRILATLGLLAIFRFGFWIYVPGINIEYYLSLIHI